MLLCLSSIVNAAKILPGWSQITKHAYVFNLISSIESIFFLCPPYLRGDSVDAITKDAMQLTHLFFH